MWPEKCIIQYNLLILDAYYKVIFFSSKDEHLSAQTIVQPVRRIYCVKFNPTLILPFQAESKMATTATLESDRIPSHHMLLDEAILARHSSRLYLPKAVPEELLNKALNLASRSSSNSNTQLWKVYLVTEEALVRLKSSLYGAAASGQAPNIIPLPGMYKNARTKFGKLLYGEGWGIARDDAEARRFAQLRNWEFFGAPVGAIVCMNRDLRGAEAVSVGMYLQTFLLALTEESVGSCVQIAIAGYPEVVRREVGIPEDMEIICGVAIGYEDAEANVNKVRSPREAVEKTTVWVKV